MTAHALGHLGVVSLKPIGRDKHRLRSPIGGEFHRVADNLFRYSSSGVYYARFQSNGKDISRSLRTTDRSLAKRRLAELERLNYAEPVH